MEELKKYSREELEAMIIDLSKATDKLRADMFKARIEYLLQYLGLYVVLTKEEITQAKEELKALLLTKHE